MMKTLGLMLAALLLCCSTDKPAIQDEVQSFLDDYTATFKRLSQAQAMAEWALNTHIVEGDSSNALQAKKAKEELAAFTGSAEVIAKASALLEQRDRLADLQRRQLERILYAAADNPQIAVDIVHQRIAAETKQTEDLFGFNFKIAGKAVSTNEIDEILRNSINDTERLQAWEASKEVGKALKEGLENLQRLRNQTVQALGYEDFFAYQVSDYGMTVAEMIAAMEQLNRELRPLYRELHTFARYALAEKYGQPVPDMLPAHWLPNRWGQDWSAMIEVQGVDLDGALRGKSAKWIIEQAENFYVSLGFPKLPESFWQNSSLYPLPPDAPFKKNNHASAWHMDLEHDVRCLMSVEPNAEWYETTHHELGHIYYYLCYTNDQVPPLLREGANRAFHEAMGSMLGLASMQKPFLEHLGLLSGNGQSDEVRALLKEALNYIVFIPWSAGVMTQFEYELYAKNLPKSQYNRRWWELVRKYQGIATPTPRGEEYCDAASKTHINDDAAQYYDYALANVLLFQMHEHIASKILNQNSHATNYYGNREIGRFLTEVMTPGGSRDWRELLREKTGEELSARAMVKYFEPLTAFLQQENQGRKHTLEDI